MRVFFTSIFTLVSVLSFAQLAGDGFYRVQNYKTGRTLFVQDNKSTGVDYAAATADMGGIVPWSITGRDYISDPQSVIYIKGITDGYNFFAQGVNTYDMLGGLPINIAKYGTTDTYRCKAKYSSMTLYLADENDDLSDPEGGLGTLRNSMEVAYSRWYVRPVNSETSDCYFGIKPTLSVGGKHYCAFYAMFSFRLKSAGMKAYVLDKYCDNKAVLRDITGMEIPVATPVIIECSSLQPIDNKIELTGIAADNTVSDNLLTGNLFCSDVNASDTYYHRNVTAYDSSTMRVLGVTSDGKLGLVKSSGVGLVSSKYGVLYLPANTAYLQAADGNLADQLTFVSEEEFVKAMAIRQVQPLKQQQVTVFDVKGHKVGEYRCLEEAKASLPKGVYVINKIKVVM